LQARDSAQHRDLIASVRRVRNSVHGFLARFDPNDDPGADRLTPTVLLVFLAALSMSIWMWLRWKYQPMQDLGHHVALAAIVADYGRAHSLYTALYDPIDPIAANSLMYEVAGHLGRFIGVTAAVRACVVFYLVGFPLATLYALRVFGRSAWGAVLAVPMSYNMVFVAGFVNMLVAVPFMILSVALFYRALDLPNWKRTLSAAVAITLLFLAHAHLFLWTGFLLFLTTLALLLGETTRSGVSPRNRLHAVAIRAAVALSAVTPALVFLWLWYRRTFEDPQAIAHPEGATAGWHDHFGATFRTVRGAMDTLSASFDLFGSQNTAGFDDLRWLFLAIAVGVALTRLHRYRRPPVFELAFGLTAVSYFMLPTGLKSHDIVAERQVSVALWLLPAMASPVPAHVSRLGRWVAIALILAIAALMLRSWYGNLVHFEETEAIGLDWVMKGAPPRLRLHYVKLDTSSAYFAWSPFAHVEKIYMGDALGQTPDTSGILSTSAILYKKGVEIHRIGDHSPDWPNNTEIWQNFDLVLTRRWRPTRAQKDVAERRGKLLRKMGDWELWTSNEATPIESVPH
jgi:hypothetical protein